MFFNLKRLRDLFAVKKENFEKSFVGSTQQVLWESSRALPDGSWETHGLSGNYLTIKTVFPTPVRNRIDTVCVTARRGGELMGEVVPAAPEGE